MPIANKTYCSRVCMLHFPGAMIKICNRFIPTEQQSIETVLLLFENLCKRHGSYKKAAMFLGISSKTLHALKKRYKNV